MNVESQQRQHQQQIHQLPSEATTTSEYANINICDGTPLLQQPMPPPPSSTLATSSSSTSLSNATFVTLGILSAPMPQHSSTSISPTSTSTFKTPLLPMPSLEDIEGSMLLAPQQHEREHEQEQILTSQPQHMHPQPIPGGILKYPPPPAVTSTITVGLPLGLGPGPGPPQQQPPTLLSGQEAYPSPPLIMPQATHTTSTMPPSTLPLNDNGSLGMNTGILRNSSATAPSHTTTNIALTNTGGSSSSNSSSGSITKTTLKNNANLNLIGGVTATGNNLRQKPTIPSTSTATATATTKIKTTTTTKAKAKTRKEKCCCACFSGARNQTAAGTGTKKSNMKHRRKTQTLCSALLTNLGICALLLAYTLLGSFIFLTIESEDSTLLQRTLASTERVTTGLSGRGTRTKSSKTSNNNDNLYNSLHGENGTLAAAAAAAATSSLSTYSAAPSSSSASSSSLASSAVSYSSSAMLEGTIPLSNVGGVGSHGGHNDFSYSNDNDVSDDDNVVAAGNGGGTNVDIDVDGVSPQLALSADTYDVRQRTIENIWDITVSLNILYKENWTKLAALEIAKFQDQLIKRLNEEALLQLSHDIDGGNGAAAGVAAGGNSPATEAVLLHSDHHYHNMHEHDQDAYEWNFAKAFLYSLTVLTTIGYGNIAPRTTLGRLVTLVYALFGIPLTLVYLSSTGGILAKIAREVFSKALCCCLCSNCGYCCYDERRMAEKERRMKRKRQQEELRKQQAAIQEPYYVHSGSMTESSFQTPEKQPGTPATVQLPDIDSLSASESRGSMHGLSILAPILLCLSMMVIYIIFGALVLYHLEEWPLLDGIYFCFMSLSTIGFGDMIPGLQNETTTTTWFCSMYIMSGMALTAMCFNVIHEEIVHRIRIVVEFKQANSVLDASGEEQNIGGGGGSGACGPGVGVGGNSGYYIAS